MTKSANKLLTEVNDVLESSKFLDLAKKQTELQADLAKNDAWSNPGVAQQKSKNLAKISSTLQPWQDLAKDLGDLIELQKLNDSTLESEITSQLKRLDKTFEDLQKQLKFSGKYDDHDAILNFSAGAGGTDAADWTEMLLRMYSRWAEQNSYKTELINKSSGEEAGLKSATLSINGPYAYGNLKNEHGVHRLVRLSPFNADHKRQTSFAMVEVLPAIETPDELALDEKDLKIDVYRAGGHGGQSVNTTDSAVRVTHIPTGINVAIQNERSQLQNKDTALKILRSRLAQLSQEQHAEKLAELKGPNQEAAWGNQIRNYVLHPYTMVKDTRSKHETTNAAAVLDGDLSNFI